MLCYLQCPCFPHVWVSLQQGPSVHSQSKVQFSNIKDEQDIFISRYTMLLDGSVVVVLNGVVVVGKSGQRPWCPHVLLLWWQQGPSGQSQSNLQCLLWGWVVVVVEVVVVVVVPFPPDKKVKIIHWYITY